MDEFMEEVVLVDRSSNRHLLLLFTAFVLSHLPQEIKSRVILNHRRRCQGHMRDTAALMSSE